jgi:Zn-dependent protease with chaperone function
VPLICVTAAVAVKIFRRPSVVFLFGSLFVISYSYFSFSYNFYAFFVCFIFAFYFGLAYFSLLVSFVFSSFLQFFPSVADELSCSVAFPDCGMLRTLVISGVKKCGKVKGMQMDTHL